MESGKLLIFYNLFDIFKESIKDGTKHNGKNEFEEFNIIFNFTLSTFH